MKNGQDIGFLSSNTALDPSKNHKVTKPTFNDGPLLVVFEASHKSTKKTTTTNNKEKRIQRSIPLTKFSGSAHVLTIRNQGYFCIKLNALIIVPSYSPN